MNIDRRMITAMVTPMLLSGEVDLGACAELARILVQQGSEGLVVTGTTGDSPTLSNEEKQSIWKSVKSAVGPEVAIIAGATNYSTKESIAGAEAALSAGADAILLTVPYYNKPTQAGLYEHFQAIASAVPLPCILYNVPSRTGSNIKPSTVFQLLKKHNNIIGIKEANSSNNQIDELLHFSPNNFQIVSGDDITAVDSILKGAVGVVSVIGNAFPSKINEVVKHALNNETRYALQKHNELRMLMSLIFEEGSPSGIKALMSELGVCENNLRLPLVPVSFNLLEAIKFQLNSLT